MRNMADWFSLDPKGDLPYNPWPKKGVLAISLPAVLEVSLLNYAESILLLQTRAEIVVQKGKPVDQVIDLMLGRFGA